MNILFVASNVVTLYCFYIQMMPIATIISPGYTQDVLSSHIANIS